MPRALRATVRQWSGIPTCVGLGPTKTLAKVANHLAKRTPALDGVCDLSDPQVRAAALDDLPVGDMAWKIERAEHRDPSVRTIPRRSHAAGDVDAPVAATFAEGPQRDVDLGDHGGHFGAGVP